MNEDNINVFGYVSNYSLDSRIRLRAVATKKTWRMDGFTYVLVMFAVSSLLYTCNVRGQVDSPRKYRAACMKHATQIDLYDMYVHIFTSCRFSSC